MKTITKRQDDVLCAIREYIRSNGMPPTNREILLELGLRSPNAVSGHLAALAKKGFIVLGKRKSRGIQLVTDCCPMCGSRRTS